MAYLMVGKAATIRCSEFSDVDLGDNTCHRKMDVLTAGLVILPSCMGTLKSTRIKTFFFLRSRSVIASLFESDMVVGWEKERAVMKGSSRARIGNWTGLGTATALSGYC
jgi:hypothetical protein